MQYHTSIIGHAPGHIREAFLEYLETHWYHDDDVDVVQVGWDEKPKPLRWLLGQLWNCTDVLPRDYSELFDDRGVGTYGIAAREVALSLDPLFEPAGAKDDPYLLQCQACGQWTLWVEHTYDVRHGPYWTQYVERGELDYQILDDLQVSEWSDCEAVEWGCDDWEVNDDELERLLEWREVEVAEHYDKFFPICSSCRGIIELSLWSAPGAEAYLCTEVRESEPGSFHHRVG